MEKEMIGNESYEPLVPGVGSNSTQISRPLRFNMTPTSSFLIMYKQYIKNLKKKITFLESTKVGIEKLEIINDC
jgi:hypothetical protein